MEKGLAGAGNVDLQGVQGSFTRFSCLQDFDNVFCGSAHSNQVLLYNLMLYQKCLSYIIYDFVILSLPS